MKNGHRRRGKFSSVPDPEVKEYDTDQGDEESPNINPAKLANSISSS